MTARMLTSKKSNATGAEYLRILLCDRRRDQLVWCFTRKGLKMMPRLDKRQFRRWRRSLWKALRKEENRDEPRKASR